MAGFDDYLPVTAAPAVTPSAQSISTPAPMPSVPEPVMQGYNTDPTIPAPADQGLTIQGYISNTIEDVKQIGGGIAAAGSAVGGRVDDWLNPHALWNPNKSVPDKFWAAQQYMPTVLSGQKNKDLDMRGLFQHDTDAINAAKLATGVAKGYYETYGQPVTEATDTKSLKPLMKLAKLPYERPVSTALDALPFVGPVAKAISPKVISAFKFVDEAATKATPFYSQLKSDVQAARELGSATSKWNNAFINEIASRLDTVEQAYKRIPDDLRDKVISAGEMRDPALYAQLAQNPDVVQFWKLANQADGRLVGELIKAGALTREEYLVAKYGPYTRATNGIDEATLWTPDGQKMLLKAKHDLDKRGIQPTYMGLMTANQVRGALKLKGGLFGKTPSRIDYKAEGLATPAPQKPGPLHTLKLPSDVIKKYLEQTRKLIEDRVAKNRAEYDRMIKVHDDAVAKRAAAEAEEAKRASDPNAIYHGTSTKVEKLLPIDEGAGSGERNLYGPGFYVTAAYDVARSYTNKGKGKNPTVYKVKWLGENPPKLFDLDEILPENLREAFADGDKYMPDDLNQTAKKIYHDFKENMADDDLYSYDAYEQMLECVDRMKAAGFDGFTHIGGGQFKKKGQVVNETPHKVSIFFDVEKVMLEELPDLLSDIHVPTLDIKDLMQKINDAAPVQPLLDKVKRLEKMLMKARTEEANVLPSVKTQSSLTPDFLKAREAGNRVAGKHHNDALDVHTARFVQGLQLLRLKDFFADIIKNPTIVKDGIKFDLHEFMRDLGKASGTRPEVVSKYIEDLPQHINLPSAAYNRLMSLMGNTKVGINAWSHPKLAALATLSKNIMLGFDMAWAVNQSAQNMMLLGMSTFRGIKDVPASLMAYAMVADKDVRSALPKHWGANFSDVNPTSSALRGAVWQDMADSLDKKGVHLDPKLVQDVAKIMAPAQIYMENVFGAAQAGDAAARAVYGAYHMLRAVENAPAAVKPALKDMMDFMASKQKVLANLNDEKLVEQAGKDINELFGKYDGLTAQDWKAMRTLFPFWLWWMHSVTLTKHIAANAPLKTSIMTHLDKQIPVQFQTDDMPDSTKKMGALPMYDYDGNRRVSQNGYPLLMNKPGFTPNGQVPELVIQGMHIGAGGPGNGGFPLMNPAVSGIIMLSGRNPSNLQEWQDPHNYKVRGAQYNEKGEEVTATALPLQNLIPRAVVPRVEAWGREVLAAPYQPSDFTTIGDGAYKLDSSTQAPLKNFGPGQSLFHMMTKLKPMEQRFDANQESTINNFKKKNFLKAQARQQGVTQQDPTAFDINWGKFLQGDVIQK